MFPVREMTGLQAHTVACTGFLQWVALWGGELTRCRFSRCSESQSRHEREHGWRHTHARRMGLYFGICANAV
jgi:hypothetical protein